MLNSMKIKLDKHHLDQIAQMNAHKALVDSDIEVFMQEIQSGHEMILVEKIGEFKREFEKFHDNQKNHKESVLKEI